ncbi:MAG: hypothetical protein HYU80_04360 [Candidatus Blackburnbacteria bacterium]|nr:hypothetical protein [Candidatus Blackburnbacteria bacterium]
MHELFWKYDRGIKVLLILFVSLLVVNIWILNSNLLEVSKSKGSSSFLPFPNQISIDTCGEKCKKIIAEEVAQAVATLSASTKTTANTGTQTGTTGTTSRTSFVSVGSAFSTKNTDWTDIKGGEMWIDPSEFGKSLNVSWEASLKIGNANGEAWARLYDVTNGIAVSGSEVSVVTSDYTTVSSGNISLWSGNNQYRVQIKSTTSQEASFAPGRIKIVGK